MSPWDVLFIKCIFDCQVHRFYIIRGIQRKLPGFCGWGRGCWKAIRKHSAFGWILRNCFGWVVHFKMLNNSCLLISSRQLLPLQWRWCTNFEDIYWFRSLFLHGWIAINPAHISIVSQQKLWKFIQADVRIYPIPLIGQKGEDRVNIYTTGRY